MNRARRSCWASFSKIAFPGLRVGWAIGPRHFIARLTEAKEASDLHSDQLSQAVVLRFAESGRLEAHREKMLTAGALRLKAILGACETELPAGSTFTKPEGGMNVWVELPKPLDASELATRAERENVSFLAGAVFRGDASAGARVAIEFCGIDAGEHPARDVDFGFDFSDGAAARTAQTERRASAGISLKQERIMYLSEEFRLKVGLGGDAEGRRHHGRHQRRSRPRSPRRRAPPR